MFFFSVNIYKKKLYLHFADLALTWIALLHIKVPKLLEITMCCIVGEPGSPTIQQLCLVNFNLVFHLFFVTLIYLVTYTINSYNQT